MGSSWSGGCRRAPAALKGSVRRHHRAWSAGAWAESPGLFGGEGVTMAGASEATTPFAGEGWQGGGWGGAGGRPSSQSMGVALCRVAAGVAGASARSKTVILTVCSPMRNDRGRRRRPGSSAGAATKATRCEASGRLLPGAPERPGRSPRSSPATKPTPSWTLLARPAQWKRTPVTPSIA